MADYLTVTELKVSGELQGTSFADYDIQKAITAASRAIDEYCGRRFWPDTSATVDRYYTPRRSELLDIDDLIALGTVSSDDNGDGVFESTWTLNTDFALWPLNAAADGKPYEQIRPLPSSSRRLRCYPRSIKVTGQFGWTSAPMPISEATGVLASRLLKRVREAPFGVVGLGIDQSAIRLARVDPEFCMLVDPFIRGRGALAA